MGNNPHATQVTGAKGTLSVDAEIWLSIFRSLAIFKSGVTGVKLEDLIEATDNLVKSVPK